MKVLTYLPHYGWMFGLATSMPNDTFYIANKLTLKHRTNDISISNGYWQWLKCIKPKPTNVKLLGQNLSEINTDDYDVAILIPDAGQIDLWKKYLNEMPIVWKFHLSNPESRAIFNARGSEVIGNYPCIFSANSQREFYGLEGDIAWSQSPEIYKDWNGKIERAMWTCERIGVPNDSRYMQRGGYIWDQIRQYIKAKRYGLDFRLGTPITAFEEIVNAYKFNRCYVECATNTILTDGLVEAMMTGMPPVVYASWEMDRVIEHGVNGFKSKDIKEIIEYTNLLLGDYDLAKEIGKKSRETALELWNPEVTKNVYHNAFKKASKIYNSEQHSRNKKFPLLMQIYRLENHQVTDDFFMMITKKKISELGSEFGKMHSNIVECSFCLKKFKLSHHEGKHIIESADGEEIIETR